MKQKITTLFTLLLAVFLLAGCTEPSLAPTVSVQQAPSAEKVEEVEYTLENLPAYSSKPYVPLYKNQPKFTAAQLKPVSFESYSELDALGRCGVAFACIGTDLMPTTERGSIGSVKPSGWQMAKYDHVEGKYLYNRCHLIGYQLSGENANRSNLITGTRYLNVTGMLPFEDMVADYVKETENHVLYRVTPIFKGDNLVADGVEMEAFSVEDNGDGICFHVFCSNCQPGVVINYKDGTNHAVGATASEEKSSSEKSSSAKSSSKNEAASGSKKPAGTQNAAEQTFVLNTSSKKVHRPTCGSVNTISAQNKKTYTGSYAVLEQQGYSPCKRCKPNE